MKHLTLLGLITAVVALPMRSSAYTLDSNLDHEHLTFSEVKFTYQLLNKDGGDIITVVREAIPPEDADPLRYKVTIKRTRKNRCTLSLLTLGVQGVMHGAKILSASAGAKFAETSDSTPNRDIPPGGLDVPKTGLLTVDSKEIPDASMVRFISFSGRECVIEMQPLPERIWTTEWITETSSREGHGVEPPY